MAITFKERMALIMAGYSKKEIKEFEAQADNEPTTETVDTPPQTESDPVNVSNASATEEDTSPSITDNTAPSSPSSVVAEEVDYKALYEQAKSDLNRAQADFRNRDVSANVDNNSDEDIFSKYVDEFFV